MSQYRRQRISTAILFILCCRLCNILLLTTTPCNNSCHRHHSCDNSTTCNGLSVTKQTLDCLLAVHLQHMMTTATTTGNHLLNFFFFLFFFYCFISPLIIIWYYYSFIYSFCFCIFCFFFLFFVSICEFLLLLNDANDDTTNNNSLGVIEQYVVRGSLSSCCYSSIKDLIAIARHYQHIR